mmetsp:Transcript_127993/g.370396  ORF Transcript_127993/g.370396 Transcript_127993/m.370396 type:complete len:457 (+) Transcript_127993:77-1447(+)|eukprot:CAMPEP_0176052466 /NCGR_PEP_ID=MMETSP0120_2-20121206/26086_1 /TAXON_ID=160619 /ORGANISM="Kryptoperidinium foliaceum, Strain CCMP 1326" /LENGTH=456 /DNA_ID=CAMNT_0017385905 /DNA_START=52 /DNA_END=1422 /DNA_ORIENTATION=-
MATAFRAILASFAPLAVAASLDPSASCAPLEESSSMLQTGSPSLAVEVFPEQCTSCNRLEESSSMLQMGSPHLAVAGSPEPCPFCKPFEESNSMLQMGNVAKMESLANPYLDTRAAEARVSGDPYESDEFEYFVGQAVNFEAVEGESYHNIFGHVWVTASTGDLQPEITLRWKLFDVDADCAMGAGTESRSCGIHILDAKSCSDPELFTSVRPLWSSKLHRNPWDCLAYTSQNPSADASEDGDVIYRSESSAIIYTGKKPSSFRHKVVVVYGFGGAPMACSKIGTKVGQVRPATSLLSQVHKSPRSLTAAEFKKYPHYDTHDAPDIWGRVLVYEMSGEEHAQLGQVMSWDLEFVDPHCKDGPGSKANSCGIHVRSSTSCDHDDEGHPQYHTSVVHKNPWQCSNYIAVQGRKVTLARGKSVPIFTGLYSRDIIGNIVVIYDFQGRPAACAKLDVTKY